MTPQQKMTIVGAGPVGCLLAAQLAARRDGRGVEVDLYERGPDMRKVGAGGGRSINLVLTRRGLRALEGIGLRGKVLELTVPVLGRMMHSVEGELTYQPYGKDESECNYSVSRDRLNQVLLDAAEHAGVKIYFEHMLVDADFEAAELCFRVSGQEVTVPAEVVLACDGAPSATRGALVRQPDFSESVQMMEWGYKELTFPAAADGSYAMAGHALHIWPRGRHFLMGLANLDGSFTGTIYLPKEGPESFSELATPERVQAFFATHYPDAIPLLGDFVDAFLQHPLGHLGTVRASPWNLGSRVVLVGDAAHGIVPFFGQGLNSGFEDCTVLEELMNANDDLAAVFQTFYEVRKPNTDAIADMALENFVEMSEKVGDADFVMRKRVESILEHELGDVYRSRYALVMYSHIPYRTAFEIGEVQAALLGELAAGLGAPEEVDLDRARALIDLHLRPLYEEHEVDLSF